MAIGNVYIILTIIIICSNIFHNVKALENKNKNKILRISFDKVEELNGEKIVVFVSNQGKSKAISKEAVQVLRSVKKEFDPIDHEAGEYPDFALFTHSFNISSSCRTDGKDPAFEIKIKCSQEVILPI